MGIYFLKLLFLVFIFETPTLAQKPCAQKTYRGPDNPMVCVCNSTYCDDFPPLGQLQAGHAAVYTTSMSGKRFNRTDQAFTNDDLTTKIRLTLNTSTTFQKIIGFGGAFTDAAGINFFNLSQNTRQNFVNSYWGQSGIGYTVGRVPMAGCDFSAREYSYDDFEGDFNLTKFALANEDFNLKIPLIKMAKALTPNLKLFTSPWAAPGWMKTDGTMHGRGSLKGPIGGQYYQTWANYFVRFFEEYNKQGVDFWGLTVQNEPDMGSLPYEEMYYNASMEKDFVKMNLGPALKANSLTQNIKVMIMDSNRYLLPAFPDTVLGDPDAAKYVDGVAIHWYADGNGSGNEDTSGLETTHQNHPNTFMLYTEACTGCCGMQPPGPLLGDWTRGDRYAHDIIEDLNHWVSGWTDWNMCLNTQGGPNWVNNYVDSPIIVNATVDEFYKNPMFYALGHFAKFIIENSVRVQLTTEGIDSTTNLEAVAFVTPSNQRVLVVNNRDTNNNYAVTIQEATPSATHMIVNLEARSFTTFVWNAPN